MVCFDFALQIPAGTVRHRSTEGDRRTDKDSETSLKKETVEGGRQWGRQIYKEIEIN